MKQPLLDSQLRQKVLRFHKTDRRGFLGCGHFSRCNELLAAQGKPPIDWARLPPFKNA
jgi:hypothetical protein